MIPVWPVEKNTVAGTCSNAARYWRLETQPALFMEVWCYESEKLPKWGLLEVPFVLPVP